MGNIIKSQLDYFPEFLQEEGLDYWHKVKEEYIEKYGKDEHHATIAIVKELNLPEDIYLLVDQVKFSLLCRQMEDDDMNVKILHYADGRVGPYGVLSYDERMNDAKKRYANREHLFPMEEREDLIECGKEMEKQIFAKCKIKPEDINDETIKETFENLKNFVLK